jgi:hypothetical protein
VSAVRINRAFVGLLALATLFSAFATIGQDAGYLDLTDPLPRERIRPLNGIGAGCGGGEGVGDVPTPSPDLTITLISLDKYSYSPGEDVTFEVKVQNTSRKIIEVPWTPHLGDLEPADRTRSYTYQHMTVALEFTDPVSTQTFGIYGNSYGSPDLAGSIRELLPGQWILVRPRQRILFYNEWWSKRFKDSTPLPAKVTPNIVLDKVTYYPGEKEGLPTERPWCSPLQTQKANSFDVILLPHSPG